MAGGAYSWLSRRHGWLLRWRSCVGSTYWASWSWFLTYGFHWSFYSHSADNFRLLLISFHLEDFFTLSFQRIYAHLVSCTRLTSLTLMPLCLPSAGRLKLTIEHSPSLSRLIIKIRMHRAQHAVKLKIFQEMFLYEKCVKYFSNYIRRKVKYSKLLWIR